MTEEKQGLELIRHLAEGFMHARIYAMTYQIEISLWHKMVLSFRTRGPGARDPREGAGTKEL